MFPREKCQRFKTVLAGASAFLLLATAEGFAAANSPHSFEVGAEVSYFKYDEDSMEEKGVFYGLDGAYTYRGRVTDLLDRVMLKGEVRGLFGRLDYDGELQDGTPYEIDDIDNYVIEVRGLGGYDFDILEKTRITPYIGFGYRYLNDDAAKDPAGYERESNYYYLPIGVEALTALANNWSLGAKVEFDYFLFGKQKSHLSDAVPSLSDVENDQEGGMGIKGSVKLVKETERLNFIIEPFVHYWDIDESEASGVTVSGTIIGTATEPENHSIEYGVRLALEF